MSLVRRKSIKKMDKRFYKARQNKMEDGLGRERDKESLRSNLDLDFM